MAGHGPRVRHNHPVTATHHRARATSALAAGSAVSGVLAYVFFALTTRALGADQAAPVSVLWAYWGFAGAALTFPVQHWISRAVAAHDGERHVADYLRHVRRAVLGLSLVVGLLAWLAREPLFGSDQVWFPLLTVLVTIGSGAIGHVRGVLSARRAFGAVAVSLVAENALRCLVAVALILLDVHEPVAFGLALVAGYLTAAAWPQAYRLRQTGEAPEAESPFAFLGGAAGGQLIGQTVLTGGPVALALADGSPAAITALFAGLALFRAPYTLALGVVASLTERMTRLVVERRADILGRVRRVLVATTAVGLVAAGVIGWWVGPPLIRLIFGDDIQLQPEQTLALALGSTFALANLVVTVILLAQNRTPALMIAWALAILPGAAWFALGAGAALDRTCWSFCLIEGTALAALVWQEWRGTRRLVS